MDSKKRKLLAEIDELTAQSQALEQALQKKQKQFRVLAEQDRVEAMIRTLPRTSKLLTFSLTDPRVECLDEMAGQLQELGLVLDKEEFSYRFNVERTSRDGLDNAAWAVSSEDCEGRCALDRHGSDCNSDAMYFICAPLTLAEVKEERHFEVESHREDWELIEDKWEHGSEFECSHASLDVAALCTKELRNKLLRAAGVAALSERGA